MKITDEIKYVGVNDHEIDLFEGQYIVPRGMAYNSYVILSQGESAIFDSVDRRFVSEWLDNIASVLGANEPTYFIVQHMEPDHSSGIVAFMEKYPKAKIVSSMKSFVMMRNYFGTDFSSRQIVVKEGDTLTVGDHTLTFVSAPMVHWPEVTVTYDSKERVLFSTDAFGKFGANDTEDPDGWDCEARRYYIGIVGKYGVPVQTLLKKASALDIDKICPLHGPVLSSPLDHYLAQYDTWSSYRPESEGVTVAYTSVYGHTKEAVERLVQLLKERGVKVELFDLARDDWAEAVESAFRYPKIVLATTTYNSEIFPFMRQFIDHLTERNFQKKKVALIENGSWGPMAKKTMMSLLEKSKEIEYAENNITILSSLSDKNKEDLVLLADELAK